MDELQDEFEKVKSSKPRLLQFHEKLSRLRFLDPACGCGNFLIVAYRELRLLELEVIKTLLFTHEKIRAEVAASAGVDVGHLVKCNVDRFYGIEYEEFPAQIAQVALWLIDHQMNMKVSETFGGYYPRIPLTKSATIVHGNALRIDWLSLIEQEDGQTAPQAPKSERDQSATKKPAFALGESREGSLQNKYHYDYILGNPPFVGKHLQNAEQKNDMGNVFAGVNGAGVLDYVAAWYIKAAQNMKQSPKTKTAFVSTNSISQGEQVGILWSELFNTYKCKIHFAHRTFNWQNEAKGNAAVHVVIIGFACFDTSLKKLYEYENIKDEPHEILVKNINPYLIEGDDKFVQRRSTPICAVPKMIWGNKPVDGGNLIIEDNELDAFLKAEPTAKKFIRRLVGATEILYSNPRWCLWLVDATPEELRKMSIVMKRIDAVKRMRESSTDVGARKLAQTPSLFRDTNNPKSFIAVPEVSSENRKYIPIGFLTENDIPTNLLQIVPDGNIYHFAVLESIMHMTWVKYVCGRLESRFRYSNSIVYNNFPWPESPTEKQTAAVEEAAQAVLDARAQFPSSSLADLYDPNTMPPVLVKAHQQLDKAVDLCYRPQHFPSETKRIEFLFELYDKYTAGLFVKEKKRPAKSNKS